MRNMGTCAEMLWEKFKQRPCKNESTDALYRDRLARSSDEAPVMGVERRGQLIQRMNLISDEYHFFSCKYHN